MDPLQVRRAYKLRAYPTRPQEARAHRLLHDHCDLYNAALQERRDAWRMQQTLISYRDQSAQLKEIRANDPAGQGRHSFTAQQQTLRRLDVVFGAFYKRVKEPDQEKRRPKRRGDGESERRIGCPRFKARQRFNQVLFVAGDGAKWEPAGNGRWAHASFQALGRLKVNQHRQVVGRIKTLQVKREHRRWFVIVITETEAEPLPSTGRTAGIDVGVARFLVTSDGRSSPTRGSWTGPKPRSVSCNAGWSGPRVVPARTSESGGSLCASGGRSATSDRTSTTRPLEPSSALTT
jgi:putative transposase